MTLHSFGSGPPPDGVKQLVVPRHQRSVLEAHAEHAFGWMAEGRTGCSADVRLALLEDGDIAHSDGVGDGRDGVGALNDLDADVLVHAYDGLRERLLVVALDGERGSREGKGEGKNGKELHGCDGLRSRKVGVHYTGQTIMAL